MHASAMKRMEWFIENYVPKNKRVKILDVGSYNVNGCYKSLLKDYDCEYVGLDLAPGPNVDFVPKDPYNWSELEDDSFDFVISGNAFEHIECPWLTMQEIAKKLKPCGIVCILTPFNLSEHRYPKDCYRYYPDGMTALAKYAQLRTIHCSTGGYPEGVNLNDWIPNENYDDTLLIAEKIQPAIDVSMFPQLECQSRSHTIFQGS